MNKPIKTKLCWNCEGSVSRSMENCPYCGVYLSPEEAAPLEKKEVSPPPYTPSNTKANEIPKAHYNPSEPIAKEVVKEAVIQSSPSEKSLLQTLFLPVSLLTAGTIALFFALILLLFSTHGKLTLEWDGDLWFIYGIIALPLLFFGWRTLEDK